MTTDRTVPALASASARTGLLTAVGTLLAVAALASSVPGRDDASIAASLDAIERAASLAYTAEVTREEVDLPTGRTMRTSVRGQVWLERRDDVATPSSAGAAPLRWKVATSTVLEAPAAEFEGAFAYWAFDGATLRMLHPEKRRADVREPTPANLSILTGFARSKVLVPGVVDPARARAGVAAATRVEALGTRTIDGVPCRGVRLHFAADTVLALSDDWNEWWIGPDDVPRRVSTNFVIAGSHVFESLRLSEVRVDGTIPGFVFAPEVPSSFGAAAPRASQVEPAPAVAPGDPDDIGTRPLAAGDRAPALELVDGTGVRHSLAARAGSVTVIDFWGTWCAPCRIALPHLDALARAQADRGLEVWAVSCQERDGADAVAFATARGYALTVLPDGDDTALRWAIAAYPTTLVVARDGTVAFVSSGYTPDGIALLERAVEAALDAGGASEPESPSR